MRILHNVRICYALIKYVDTVEQIALKLRYIRNKEGCKYGRKSNGFM